MERVGEFIPLGVSTLPLYAYRCTQCGHKFEKIQNFSAEPETKCPECGGVLERPLTAPRLNFKGAGWYVNDYAPKSGSSEGSSSGSDSDSKAESKADSKSDSKGDSGGGAKETKPAAPSSESKPSAPAASNPPAATSGS